jgi:hypothetical protein
MNFICLPAKAFLSAEVSTQEEASAGVICGSKILLTLSKKISMPSVVNFLI